MSWSAAGATAAPATIGTLGTALPAAASTLFDLAGSLEVDLARADLTLEDADDDRLDRGANLALAGDELIQFGRAEPLGGTRWRLSRLLRGRRGTEAAAGAQAVGDRFVLLADDSLHAIELPLAALGSQVRIMASGIGDRAGPVEAIAAITGSSVRPPSPVHVSATLTGDGGAAVSWVRRSRAGWRWIDGADVPLGEEAEAYDATITSAAGAGRTLETDEPAAIVTADERAGGSATIAVRQRGTQGASPAATLQINQGA